MSSANGDRVALAAMPSSPARSWSLTRRLTALYTLSAFAILLLPTVYLYSILARSFEKEDGLFLADKLRVMRAIVREEPQRPEALAEEIGRETPPNRFGRYYARVLVLDGRVLIETPGMDDALPPATFPSGVAASDTPDYVLGRRASEGRSFLLLAAGAEVGSNSDRRLVQLALDVSQERALIADYRRNMTVMLLLGIFLSAAAGIVVTRRGLEPLAQITKAAERITPFRLHERIGGGPWPRELAVLARVFDAMLGRLEDSFKRLTSFSADLAHELRTPITNLMGEAEVALGRVRTPEEYRQVLESSLEEYQRLSRMTESLLFLARADNDRSRIEPGEFEARREIEAVREFYNDAAEDGGVGVTCSGTATVRGDPILFRRAVTNLLSNALRHTPRGGRIAISIEKSPEGAVDVHVQDTGCGIPPEHLSRVFDRFYRVDPSRSHRREGAGLGLAIVKSIMDLHGGTATVRNASGGGTIVTLTFPQTE